MSSLTNPDIRVQLIAIPSPISVLFDWLQTPDGMLDQSHALATAVTIALGTDGLAMPTDELPDIGDTDRRGWWGDIDADTIWQGWPVGSRLWLMTRAKITDATARQGSTVANIENYVREALQPFVTAKICSRFTVNVTRTGRETIVTKIRMYRGPLPDIVLEFQSLWDFIRSSSG